MENIHYGHYGSYKITKKTQKIPNNFKYCKHWEGGLQWSFGKLDASIAHWPMSLGSLDMGIVIMQCKFERIMEVLWLINI